MLRQTTAFCLLALFATTPLTAQPSRVGRAQRDLPLEPVTVPETAPGVLLELYDIQQAVYALPDLVPGQLPNLAEVRTTIDFGDGSGGFGDFKDNFLTTVAGYVEIETAGDYVFRLISDDGSKLWIDDKLVVDHDGPHGATPKDGAITLASGLHTLLIRHFEMGGGERLLLEWQPPSAKAGEFSLVPARQLKHDAAASRETAPGRKRFVTPLRRGRPGDGSPLEGMHPGYDVFAGRAELATETTPAHSTRRFPTMNRNSLPEVPVYAWLPAEVGAVMQSAVRVVSEGPFAGQTLVGDLVNGGIWRVFADEYSERAAGCVLRFAGPQEGGVRSILMGKDGEIYVERPGPAGTPQWQRLQATGKTVFEIAGVRMMTNGLEIEFTRPLDPRVGWDPESYLVEQWPFDITTGQRPARDGTRTPVRSAGVSADRRRVFLAVDELKPGHVVYVRLLPPCISEDGEPPLSTEAWYTLHKLPRERAGETLPQPPQPPQNVLTDEERAAGWELLFDGRTTAGWRGFRKPDMPDGWQVHNGCLTRLSSGGDIVTVEQFDNFELRIDWRICAAGNSGIFFRVSEEYDAVWRTGPEMQVLDNTEHADGRNALTSAGSNYALHAPCEDVTEPVGLWNQARLVADGNHIEHWLNGKKLLEYELFSADWQKRYDASKFKSMPDYGREKTGHIALQDHGDRVAYRNIKIRRLKQE